MKKPKELIDLPKGYSELLLAAARLREAVRERQAWTKKLQDAATEARRTGKPGQIPHRSPEVFSLDDEIFNVCDAVDKIRKIGSEE